LPAHRIVESSSEEQYRAHDVDRKAYTDRWSANTSATPQEQAWSGEHGVQYVLAHLGENWKGSRAPYWKVILGPLPDVGTVCEFGCNIGANLKAIKQVRPDAELTGIEINMIACEILRMDEIGDIHHGSIADKDLGKTFDLVFSRGVLIHLNPDDLKKTLQNMAKHSRRYV
jgi:spore coat polysaccharide biosynthesis protein SpsF